MATSMFKEKGDEEGERSLEGPRLEKQYEAAEWSRGGRKGNEDIYLRS